MVETIAMKQLSYIVPLYMIHTNTIHCKSTMYNVHHHTFTHTTLHKNISCFGRLFASNNALAGKRRGAKRFFFFSRLQCAITKISIIILSSYVSVRLQWFLGCLGIIQWYYLSVSSKQHRSSIDKSRVAHDSYFRSFHRIIFLLPSVTKSKARYGQPSHRRNYLSDNVSA